jgi:ParB-like nuclease domain
MHVEMRDIATIKLYSGNPRRNDHAVAAVAASIREYGFRQPLVLDEDGVIVVGSTRYLAAVQLGMNEVPVHVATGLTPAQLKAYRICDNRTAEIADWDYELLVQELAGLQQMDFDLDLVGFSPEELRSRSPETSGCWETTASCAADFAPVRHLASFFPLNRARLSITAICWTLSVSHEPAAVVICPYLLLLHVFCVYRRKLGQFTFSAGIDVPPCKQSGYRIGIEHPAWRGSNYRRRGFHQSLVKECSERARESLHRIRAELAGVMSAVDLQGSQPTRQVEDAKIRLIVLEIAVPRRLPAANAGNVAVCCIRIKQLECSREEPIRGEGYRSRPKAGHFIEVGMKAHLLKEETTVVASVAVLFKVSQCGLHEAALK